MSRTHLRGRTEATDGLRTWDRGVVRAALRDTAAVVLAWVGLLTGLTAAAAAPTFGAADREGLRPGLWLHVGCGAAAAAGLTADLAASPTGDLLVHGLALDAESLARARQAARDRGLADRVQVERLTGPALPHVDGVADVVVVSAPEAVAAAGLTAAELNRVLTPGGILLEWHDGHWRRTVRPRPATAGQWTHPMATAGANRVATDPAIAFPLGLRWQDGLPLNIVHWASVRSYVAAGGRVFSVSMTEPENLRAEPGERFRKQQWLVGRNAACGLRLWAVRLETQDERSDLSVLNLLPLATDGARVFAPRGQGLLAVDAATGAVQHEFAVSFPTERLVALDGVVAAAGWKKRARMAMWDPATPKAATSSLWDIRFPDGSGGAVEAFDAATGARLWQDPVAAQSLLADAGLAVYVAQEGVPITAQTVVARDLHTGAERWRVPHTAVIDAPDLLLLGVGRGLVMLGRHKAGSTGAGTVCGRAVALSLADGLKRWETEADGGPYCLFTDDAVWYGSQRYNPLNGQVLGPTPAGLHPSMCTPPVLMGAMAGSGRGGSWADLTAASKAADGKVPQSRAGGVRASCIQGVAVADSRVYIAQNWCRCSPAHLPGFLALGAQTDPTAADFAAARPVESGAATAAVAATAATAAWPTFRADPERSAACAFAVAPNLAIRGTVPVAPPAVHALAEAWQTGLEPWLSAPVAAGDTAYVAACESGELVAVDLVAGRERWRAATGSRLDSPPTLAAGLCLAGSHDGWLYAFGATDGTLAWRTRVAPQERRLVAFGKVESSWPVVGAPLVQGDTVYAVAGRSTEMDGGSALVAADLATGAGRWAAQVRVPNGRRTDVLAWHDGKPCMQGLAFDPANGQPANLAEFAAKGAPANLDGLLDGSWTRLGNRRSGGHACGQLKADVLAWDGEVSYGFSTDGRLYGCFAITAEAAAAADPKKPETATFLWRAQVARERTVEALAVTPNAVLAAGRAWSPDGKQPMTGFLLVLDRTDGHTLTEVALPAPVVHHGLCVVPGRVIAALENGTLAWLTASREGTGGAASGPPPEGR